MCNNLTRYQSLEITLNILLHITKPKPKVRQKYSFYSFLLDSFGIEMENNKFYNSRIRFDENFSRDVTKIKYLTEGILIRELMGDPLLNTYSAIILDEVHVFLSLYFYIYDYLSLYYNYLTYWYLSIWVTLC